MDERAIRCAVLAATTSTVAGVAVDGLLGWGAAEPPAALVVTGVAIGAGSYLYWAGHPQ
jgi:hypothetical protein